MKKIAIILSGCGYLDGTEITEAVSLMIALSQAGAEFECFAPDIELKTFDHAAKSSEDSTRNVLKESARIARSKVKTLTELNEADFDALTLPGGYGAAKNLCDWAEKGVKCEVHPLVSQAILNFYNASKPIGAMCIAPVIVAKVLGKHKVTVTIGDDATTAQEITKTGAVHEECPVEDYITDREHKVVTTPAYMYPEAKPHEVFQGIFGLAHEIVEWA